MSTAAEREHMGRVAALCCVLCRHLGLADDTPAIVHHLRTGQGRMRASHYDTLPLCPAHHQHSGFGVEAAAPTVDSVELLSIAACDGFRTANRPSAARYPSPAPSARTRRA